MTNAQLLATSFFVGGFVRHGWRQNNEARG
jgi:hypothetical protein